MSKFSRVLLAGLLILGPIGSATGDPLRVFAASSLTEPLREIAARFQQTTGHSVELNFGATNELRLQLEHGARADVFASASTEEMDRAVRSGLARSPRVFARNSLVVAVPRTNRAGILTLGDLARPGVKIVTAHPNVPIGAYTLQCLARMADDPMFGPSFAQSVRNNFVSLEPNVKSVTAKVIFGEADAGIIYRSDVTPEVARETIVLQIPAALNVIVTHPVAFTSPSSRSAAAFVEYLTGPAAWSVLARWNFLPPQP